MKIMIIAAAVLATALTGCSSDDGDKDTGKVASSESPTSPTPTVEPMTLKEVCPEVEAALPNGFIPKEARLTEFVDKLEELAAGGDTETKNAIAVLQGPTTDMRDAVAADAQGGDLVDANIAWLDGITAFADRCKAAGSSALQ